MIDHRNLCTAIEVLNDILLEFPVIERVQGVQDEMWNIVAQRVKYTVEKLREEYNEQADKSGMEEYEYFNTKHDERREMTPLEKVAE